VLLWIQSAATKIILKANFSTRCALLPVH